MASVEKRSGLRWLAKYNLQASLTKFLLVLPAERVVNRYFFSPHAGPDRHTQRTSERRLRAARGKNANRAAHHYDGAVALYRRVAKILKLMV